MERNPVLLIHGINDTAKIFQRMRTHLEARGWEVHAISLSPNNGDVGLDELARQVDCYVKRTFGRAHAIDLVGFSMGGIVCRYYLQKLGGLARVDRFITISSPHHGSLMAYLCGNVGCEQMRPNSPFLRDLNHQLDQLNQVQFTSIWTPLDLMILPASSSSLPIGTEIKVPVLGHAWMVSDPTVLVAVTSALSRPLDHNSRKQDSRKQDADNPDLGNHESASVAISDVAIGDRRSLSARVPQTQLPGERNI